MSLHPLAGKPAPRELLVNVPRLISAYYTELPDPANPAQRVSFGTSGHRGSSFKGTFTDDHIAAICQAIVDAVHQRQLPLSIPRQVDESPGAGLCGVVDGRRVRFGTLSFAHADAPASDWGAAMLRHMDYLACSGSFIDVDGELAGLLVFSDNVRRETPQTLRRLRARGIERIVMLTGDRLETAEMVALSAGIDELRAGLIPEDKVRAVQEGCLRATTLMVGDGINDAPALAAANVGVAMGASGATASAQAAGVVLLVDRLDRLVEALDIARQTRHIARQGVLVGMGMSLLAMVVAALG